MCKVLEQLSDAEGREMKDAVDDLVRWKSKVTGGMLVMSALMGLALWMVNRTFNKSDEVTRAIIGLEKELAVFRQEVQPFIKAGPRFTLVDYEARSKADSADVKEWVRSELAKYPPQWLRDQVESHERRINKLETQ